MKRRTVVLLYLIVFIISRNNISIGINYTAQQKYELIRSIVHSTLIFSCSLFVFITAMSIFNRSISKFLKNDDGLPKYISSTINFISMYKSSNLQIAIYTILSIVCYFALIYLNPILQKFYSIN